MSHPRNSTNFAAIDIGSHTLRLLVASCTNRQQVRPLLMERHITRLARGFQDQQLLQEPTMAHSIKVLKHYNEKLRLYNVRHVACGATGVVRYARNAEQFRHLIRTQTGIKCRILTDSEEATLSARGMLSVLPNSENPTLCFDLGGSTTEFSLVDSRDRKLLTTSSVFLGAATITERFLRDIPVSQRTMASVRSHISSIIQPVLEKLSASLNVDEKTRLDYRIAGTAGTVTTLAAMRLELTTYQPHLINGTMLQKGWIDDLIERLGKLSLPERRALPGLEPGREDIILGGAVIVAVILDATRQQELIVTDAGLLEGLLIDKISEINPALLSPANPLTWNRESE